MTIHEKHLFTVIGKVFYEFMTGNEPKVGDLRLELGRLNSLHLYHSIPDAEYEYLVEILQDCIAFLSF